MCIRDSLKIAVLLQMTLPGVPLIYYGDEAWLKGGKDPDNRKPYPWGKENIEVINIYKLSLIHIFISNAVYWLHEYHIDGLRVDAVSNILYLDYGRQGGEDVYKRQALLGVKGA